MRYIKMCAAVVAALLTLGLAPQAAFGDHCGETIILSGIDIDGNKVGSNPGAPACTVNDPDVHPHTDYTVPGAIDMWVGVFSTVEDPRGTVTIDGGDPIDLEFEVNDVRGRWESQSISLVGVAPGATIVSEVVVYDDGEGYVEVETITYTRI